MIASAGTSRSQYRVQFTVEARASYDELAGECRARLDKAVRLPARDPFAYVGPGMKLEYMVAGTVLVIVALEFFEETHYLIDEVDA